MGLRGEQRADVAPQDEIGLPGALDGLHDLRVAAVDEVAHLVADVPLPRRQGVDVGVDPRVLDVGHPGPPFRSSALFIATSAD